MTIPFKKLKDEWMKSPSFRAEYKRLKPEFALALIRMCGNAGPAQAASPAICSRRGRWPAALKKLKLIKSESA